MKYNFSLNPMKFPQSSQIFSQCLLSLTKEELTQFRKYMNQNLEVATYKSSAKTFYFSICIDLREREYSAIKIKQQTKTLHLYQCRYNGYNPKIMLQPYQMVFLRLKGV